MGREWKPGEVAMVTDPVHGRHIALRLSDCWHLVVEGEQTRCLAEDAAEDASPLVVIDPEDREQVERLGDIFCTYPSSGWVDQMQAALREFANPTPPKPEEPTGKYAEVEDAEGVVWFRDRNGIWRRPDFTGTDWDNIAAVRVLSEGWTA